MTESYKRGYALLQHKYEALRDYLIEDKPQERKSLGMFFEMVNDYRKMPNTEQRVHRKDFLKLIARLEDVVVEEYGRAHILAGVAKEYLDGVRKI